VEKGKYVYVGLKKEYSMLDLSGARIDNYQILNLIGKGAFGEVYLAEHVFYKTHVAIKVLYAPLNTQNMGDFINEVRVFRFEHPNIARVRDCVVEDERLFLVMNYMPHGNLRQRHPRGTQLSWEEIVLYAKQVADALQCIHDQGVVHRDVKPENMLVGPNGEILLADFGIATTSYTWDSRREQQAMGTPAYIAPEQVDAKAVRASDQYALGAIMYEWLTGDPPFKGTRDEVVLQHCMTSPILLRQKIPTISPQVETVVMKMLAKKPEDRFDSMREFSAALDHLKTSPLSIDNFIFKEHTDGVRALAWSPNGKYVASASRDTTVQVCEPATRTRIYSYHGHVDEIWSVDWSPDSRYIVSASSDETVRIWEATTGYAITLYDGHISPIRAVAWSPDGRFIATGGDDKTVQIWEARTGKHISTYHHHTRAICAIAWSPDSIHVASGGDDRIVRVWQAATGSYVQNYSKHIDRITSISWSPDGKYIASAGDDYTIQVWQALSGQQIYTYTGHSDTVAAVSWSPNGGHIASASWDKTVHIWGLDKESVYPIYRGHSSWVNALAWSPDGQCIASGSWDKTVHIVRIDQ
jgi:eukaryotic-like serine/threonine-protein kinase